ncbi:MAG: uridine kinase [Firmicutes bacterium]|nr:uridine kinase [Bacillota bacterium]
MKDPIIIGIAGGTGSGKSTLVQEIAAEFKDDSVCLLSHDYYYKAHDDMPFEQRCKLNYDHPNAYDTDMLIEHLQLLKQGLPVHRPVYDFADHNRAKEVVEVNPAKVIIVEGILIFADETLRDLFDIKLFVDTDADVRILRRILRDVEERGRTLESVVTQYLTTVKPMHEQFVEPSKKYADIIIPEGGRNHVALSMVNHRIRALLREAEE